MRSIGEVIRELRKAKGMTLEKLAIDAGTDTGNLSRLERGQQGHTEERLRAIAIALDMTVADLWVLAALESDEIDILQKYRCLGSKGKDHTLAVIDALAAREGTGNDSAQD